MDKLLAVLDSFFAHEGSVQFIATKHGVARWRVQAWLADHVSEADRREHSWRRVSMLGNKRSVGRKKSEAELGRLHNRWGEKNPNWKGDDAMRDSCHPRAVRRFPIAGQVCEHCGAKAQVRHHRDEDPHHNVAENIAFLCRACHMKHHKVQRPMHVQWASGC